MPCRVALVKVKKGGPSAPGQKLVEAKACDASWRDLRLRGAVEGMVSRTVSSCTPGGLGHHLSIEELTAGSGCAARLLPEFRWQEITTCNSELRISVT